MEYGRQVRVFGGGPAGSSAAIAALSEGARVRIFEKSSLPRHKVCGEFFAPEAAPVLERMGAWPDFRQSGPAVIRRLILHFGKREARCNLAAEAFGLSRYQFDRLLLNRAAALGANVVAERVDPVLESRTPPSKSNPVVWALGRHAEGPRGMRLFGFKAHFRGPVDDAVELFFRGASYAGVSPIEDSLTNVCGLASEDQLARYAFRIDEFAAGFEMLAKRLAPLTRVTKWFLTGPLVYGERNPSRPGTYPAGDAFAFLDPFLGSGLVNALVTGRSAGFAAALGRSPCQHIEDCRRLLRKPLLLSAFFRKALERGLADRVGGIVPAGILFRVTRIGCRVGP